MIQLSIDGTNLTKREIRQATNSLAFSQMFPSMGNNWLKLTRAGNTFGAYHSSNGINWSPVFIVNIPMSNCIEVGLITENAAPSGPVTGVFENVSLSGNSAGSMLLAPSSTDIAESTT